MKPRASAPTTMSTLRGSAHAARSSTAWWSAAASARSGMMSLKTIPGLGKSGTSRMRVRRSMRGIRRGDANTERRNGRYTWRIMYDVLRATYRFHCPRRPDGELTRVALSAFRLLERLPGAVHPAVFRVEYDCACGDRHQGLVSHDDLDYGPLNPVELQFCNLLTGRTEPVGDELAELARMNVQRGNWPWRLYCSGEARLRPVWPSSLAMVAPARAGCDDVLGVAMSCPAC